MFNPGYRAARYIWAGLFLGGIAGCTSLLFNVIGSVLWPAISGEAQHPLRIIQVYLTFPLGETALQLGQRNSPGSGLRFVFGDRHVVRDAV